MTSYQYFQYKNCKVAIAFAGNCGYKTKPGGERIHVLTTCQQAIQIEGQSQLLTHSALDLQTNPSTGTNTLFWNNTNTHLHVCTKIEQKVSQPRTVLYVLSLLNQTLFGDLSKRLIFKYAIGNCN